MIIPDDETLRRDYLQWILDTCLNSKRERKEMYDRRRQFFLYGTSSDQDILYNRLEPHLDLVECFDRETNTCPIDGVCGLKAVLRHATSAFLGVLDGHTLADFEPRAAALIKVWRRHQSDELTG